MGHKNNNIYSETIETLKGMQAYGTSKHQDKKDGCTRDKIYSYSTFKNYKDKCMDFVDMVRHEHKCKSLSEARQYVGEFLQSKIDKGYSAWTIKLYASALGKLYQVPANSFIELPERTRKDIVRSRNIAVRDKHFSETKNATLVEFCKNTGLRRSELESLKSNALFEINGQYYIRVESGKGGKSRDVMVLDNNPVVIEKMLTTPKGERVWGKVHSACDVHGYRSDYANALYRKYARPTSELSRSEIYYTRKDVHLALDRQALHIVSQNLGHERLCVCAYSYIR